MMIYQHTNMQTYQHTNMQIYHYGDIYCRFYSSFQRKAEQSFPFTKAKQARGFMSAKRSGGCAVSPINLPLASLRAYLSGKPCIRPPHAKRAFENGNDRPHPPTEREKIRWGYMGKQVVGTATAERQTDGTPQGIYGENTVAY